MKVPQATLKKQNYLYNLIKLHSILYEGHALSSGSFSQNLHFTIWLYQIESVVHTGLFKMIVGVLTSCHTQYT